VDPGATSLAPWRQTLLSGMPNVTRVLHRHVKPSDQEIEAEELLPSPEALLGPHNPYNSATGRTTAN
jgi:hypothetical protein